MLSTAAIYKCNLVISNIYIFNINIKEVGWLKKRIEMKFGTRNQKRRKGKKKEGKFALVFFSKVA